jgi:hypothetical protein
VLHVAAEGESSEGSLLSSLVTWEGEKGFFLREGCRIDCKDEQ